MTRIPSEEKKSMGDILLVDDNPNNLELLLELLTQKGYEVRPAISGFLALKSANMSPPDLILLDIRMPEMDGYEVCRRLKGDKKTADVPVLFISALEETVDKVKAFEIGGVDFISKPFQAQEVLARVGTHLALRRMQTRLEKQNAELERYQEHLEELVQRRTAELREAHDKIGAILKSVPDGLLVTDKTGGIILMNRSAEKVLGAPLEKFIGRPASEAVGEETLLLGAPAASPMELHLLDHGHGEVRTFQILTSPVEGAQGESTGVIVVLRDVTRERESDRLKSEFISTAAHELSTPLTSIMGYSELLLEDGTEKEEQAEYLATIHEKGKDLAAIVDELLQLSRMETGRPLLLAKASCSLEKTLVKVVSDYRKECPNRLFELSLPEEKLEIEADGSKIEQVLDNLLSNAVKFSPEGGAVRVSAKVEEEEIRIAVQDEGIGLEPEKRRRAFEKFYRVDSSTTAVGGFGLGLTIAQKIVEAHGGRIWLESEKKKGTTATFSLPLPKKT